MKVLVIGGGGYVGRIVQKSLEAQHQVSYFDLAPIPGAEDRSFAGDLADTELVRRALEGQDAVIFMAMGMLKDVKASYDHIDPSFNVNVRDQYRVLKIGLEMGIRKFILISTLSVYRQTRVEYIRDETDPADSFSSPYGISKRLAENLHQAAAVEYPDGVFLCLRFMLPRNEEDFQKVPPFDPAKGMQNSCALGPNDLRSLMLASLECSKPGCHIVQTTGDVTGVRYPNTRATELLGWAAKGH
jgi:hypothetical protein